MSYALRYEKRDAHPLKFCMKTKVSTTGHLFFTGARRDSNRGLGEGKASLSETYGDVYAVASGSFYSQIAPSGSVDVSFSSTAKALADNVSVYYNRCITFCVYIRCCCEELV